MKTRVALVYYDSVGAETRCVPGGDRAVAPEPFLPHEFCYRFLTVVTWDSEEEKRGVYMIEESNRVD